MPLHRAGNGHVFFDVAVCGFCCIIVIFTNTTGKVAREVGEIGP